MSPVLRMSTALCAFFSAAIGALMLIFWDFSTDFEGKLTLIEQLSSPYSLLMLVVGVLLLVSGGAVAVNLVKNARKDKKHGK